MSFKRALRLWLLVDPAIKAAAAKRVDWTITPQKNRGLYPRVVLTVVSDPHDQHYGGDIGVRRTRVQIDLYDDEQGQERLEALTEAVKPRIMGPFFYEGVQFGRTFIDTVRDLSADSGTGFVLRQSIDAQFTHDG